VYHANYLIWCELGRTDFIRATGKPYAELERDGVRLAVSDAQMRFHASARYDDPIVVHTRLVELRSRAMRFSYRIRSASSKKLLVSASTALVSTDDSARLVRLPESIRQSLQELLSPEFDREQ
jgi:acyl-CoA thioester hydrolase